MKKLSFLVSLTTDQNDYQQEQAIAARQAAQRLGVDVSVVFADNDAIVQSQQLLNVIQSSSGPRPDAIVCQPVGTGLAQVASAAANAGIGWAVMRDADYLSALRSKHRLPIFSISVDQEEVGRIQGRQFAKLLPEGGMILYIQGPFVNSAVQVRTMGMQATKPDNIQVRMLRGQWTEESGYEAIVSWLRLSTSHQTPIRLIAAQNDNMALGARKAFEKNTSGAEGEKWSRLPFTGCDARPERGQEWVRKGLLAASIIMPPTTGLAIESLVRSLQSNTLPPERTLISPSSFPEIEKLGQDRGRAASSGLL
jgi:ribose transport system substrate-binding protein